MKALDFLHALSLPNADPIGLAKKMQDDLDHLVKTVQDKSQENYGMMWNRKGTKRKSENILGTSFLPIYYVSLIRIKNLNFVSLANVFITGACDKLASAS